MLEKVTFEQLEVPSVCEALSVYGIAIVQRYLDSETLEALTAEARKASAGADCLLKHEPHISNEDGETAIFASARFGPAQRALADVFLSESMRNLAHMYFGSHNISLNDKIYFTHERHDERPILPWHFDREQSLKFYLNLIDVDEGNGAFGYCLKSHREGNLRANYHIFKGVPIHKLPNDIPVEETYNATPVCAKAGDLIIFDSAGFHSGGVVGVNRERLVLRGHTHPPHAHSYGLALPFSAQWWIRSPFNLVKLLARSVERRPTASDSKAINTRQRTRR